MTTDPPRSSSAKRDSALKRLLREPLVHFLVAGAVIFAVLSWRTPPDDPASRQIHVSREDQARLSVNFAEIMGRPPTQAELDALVDRWVRDEVLYREALRLGLDDGDAVVRKRLAQKMDVLAASAADTETPGNEALQKWLNTHPERFATDMTLTFDQLYFTTRGRAVVARTLLEGGADWTRVGDPVSLPAHFEKASRKAISDEIGVDFAHAVGGMTPGKGWQGPIDSALGWHLVRLTAKEPGVLPPLASIRTRVENDWRAETGRQRQEAAYKTLRDAYTVRIDR